MKLTVDENLCSGHGRCYAMAPELLEGDDMGYVSMRGTVIDVPADQEAKARKAVNWCPEKAMRLIEDDEA